MTLCLAVGELVVPKVYRRYPVGIPPACCCLCDSDEEHVGLGGQIARSIPIMIKLVNGWDIYAYNDQITQDHSSSAGSLPVIRSLNNRPTYRD